jgi:hypothetical protein
VLTFQFRLEREDRRPFLIRSYSIRTQISLLGIYRVWNYRGGPIELMDQFDVYTRGLNEISQVSGANTGIPIVLCADREGRNRFSFGMLDQVEATNLRVGDWSLGLSPRGEGLNFAFEFDKPAGYEITRTTLVYVVNASDADRVLLMLDAAAPGRWRAVIRDCFLVEARAGELGTSGAKLLVDESIPQGGLLELHTI